MQTSHEKAMERAAATAQFPIVQQRLTVAQKRHDDVKNHLATLLAESRRLIEEHRRLIPIYRDTFSELEGAKGEFDTVVSRMSAIPDRAQDSAEISEEYQITGTRRHNLTSATLTGSADIDRELSRIGFEEFNVTSDSEVRD